jgi:hypothetical protein
MLEVASALVGRDGWGRKQAHVELRAQGADRWDVGLWGSDSVHLAPEVARGTGQFAIVNPATAIGPAVRGAPPFAAPLALASIATIPSHDQLGLAVARRLGVATLEDIAARKIPLRLSLRVQRDHSALVMIEHVLGSAGLSLADLERWGGTITYDEGIPDRGERKRILASGGVDAVFDEGIYNWVDGALDAGMRFLSLSDRSLAALEALGYRRAIVARERYPRLETDVVTLDFSGFLVYCRADEADELVAAFCDALVERRDRIPWQGGSSLPLERMCVDAIDAPIPIPLHPAAERSWRAQGYLA